MDQKAGLFSSEELLNILALSNNATAIYTTGDLVIRMANDAMIALWGKDRSVIGKTLIDAVPELDGQPFIDILKNVWNTGTTYKANEIPAKLVVDGQLVTSYFNFIYRAVNDDNGQIKCILHTATNVTEQRRSRLALEEQRDRMQRFFMQAPAGICILDGPDLVFELVNPTYQQLLPNRELLGKPIAEAIPEIKDQPILPILHEVYSTGNQYEGNEVLVPISRTAQGVLEDCYFNFTYQARRGENGEIDGVLAFVIEVTDSVLNRHKIEENEASLQKMLDDLKESENRMQSIVDSAPFPIGVYKGREMRIVLANKTIMDVFGKGYDVVGKLYSEVLPELDNQEIFSQLDEVYTTGVPFHARNQRVDIVVDGQLQPYYFNYSFTPLFDTAGNIYGVMNTAAEVTDIVLAKQRTEQSEAELLEIKQRLEYELEAGRQVQRQKDGFIGMASHELKTPLTTLSAIIQVTNAKLKSNPDPFLSGALDKANLQVKRMTAMINGFLNVSRLESGNILIEKQVFRVDSLIQDMVDEIKLIAPGYSIHFADRQPVELNADRDKIGSVISNFLSNAVKYSPKASAIEVHCSRIGDEVQVSVKDAGMGIKSQDIEKIFDRYYRVEASHTRHISGFGIGLYLSAEIIRRHDGEIWVESEPGDGSTFYFRLPAA